jgi:hypothetical protein
LSRIAEAPHASLDAAPQVSGTILRETGVVDPVTHAPGRSPQDLPPGPMARRPFVPAFLASFGEQGRSLSLPEAAFAPASAVASSGSRDIPVIERAYQEAPMRALPSSGAVAVAAPPRSSIAMERLPLPARASVSAGRDAMDVRAPEMPLPPRDRTAVAAHSNTLVQRSELGSAPAGDAAPSATSAAPSAPAHDADHTPEPASGGANEVNLLANEVWSLLRRRLAYEAERMGR